MLERVRAVALVTAGIGALIYAFWPPGDPLWVGIAGTLLGAEPLARARSEVR